MLRGLNMDRQSGINVKKHLSNLFRARFPIIYIPTWEESRAIEILSDIANDVQLIKTQRTLYIWSQTLASHQGHGDARPSAWRPAPGSDPRLRRGVL